MLPRGVSSAFSPVVLRWLQGLRRKAQLESRNHLLSVRPQHTGNRRDCSARWRAHSSIHTSRFAHTERGMIPSASAERRSKGYRPASAAAASLALSCYNSSKFSEARKALVVVPASWLGDSGA